jgi:hypothetical protein
MGQRKQDGRAVQDMTCFPIARRLSGPGSDVWACVGFSGFCEVWVGPSDACASQPASPASPAAAACMVGSSDRLTAHTSASARASPHEPEPAHTPKPSPGVAEGVNPRNWALSSPPTLRFGAERAEPPGGVHPPIHRRTADTHHILSK